MSQSSMSSQQNDYKFFSRYLEFCCYCWWLLLMHWERKFSKNMTHARACAEAKKFLCLRSLIIYMMCIMHILSLCMNFSLSILNIFYERENSTFALLSGSRCCIWAPRGREFVKRATMGGITVWNMEHLNFLLLKIGLSKIENYFRKLALSNWARAMNEKK